MVVQRKTSSKNDIKKAFATLLNEKGLEKITVSDITRAADVNRGTFYSHYTDKYDLLNEIEDEILSDLKKIFISSSSESVKNANLNNKDKRIFSDESILSSAKYAKDNYEMIRGLISNGQNTNILLRFKKIVISILQTKASELGILNFNRFEIPDEYAYEIMLSSIISILQYWILNGAKESPEEIVKIVNTAASVAPTEFLM